MRAIAITEPGGPEVLQIEERIKPAIKQGEVLIRVVGAGVNRPDALQRAGAYPPPAGASDLPGLEVSGVIAEVAEDVQDWQPGDTVLALTPGGGYAEYCVAPASHVLPIPKGMGFLEAAGVAETAFTVWSNVFDRVGLRSGESFLVHGGTSGIGTTAIQFAKAFGATVFTTVGSEYKAEAARNLGADFTINYKTHAFEKEILRLTEKRGVDVILDMVGGDYVERNWIAAAVEGRICQIATLNGASQSVNFSRLMAKRLVHTGSTLRPRSVDFKARIAASLRDKVWPLYESGQVKVVMDQVFDLERAADAHARMESSGHIGKIVLKVSEA